MTARRRRAARSPIPADGRLRAGRHPVRAGEQRRRRRRSSVIAPAAAVPAPLLRPLCHLSGASAARPVLTFDYRGIGGSAPDTLQRLPRAHARLVHPRRAGRDRLGPRAPIRDRPLHWVGHSMGGFATGLAHNNRADRPPAQRRHAQRLLGPHAQPGALSRARADGLVARRPSCARLGYFPGALMGGEDMPGPAFLEWARWCMTPEFIFGDATLTEVRTLRHAHGPDPLCPDRGRRLGHARRRRPYGERISPANSERSIWQVTPRRGQATQDRPPRLLPPGVPRHPVAAGGRLADGERGTSQARPRSGLPRRSSGSRPRHPHHPPAAAAAPSFEAAANSCQHFRHGAQGPFLHHRHRGGIPARRPAPAATSCARCRTALFDAAQQALQGQVAREFLKSQIEVGTSVHNTPRAGGRRARQPAPHGGRPRRRARPGPASPPPPTPSRAGARRSPPSASATRRSPRTSPASAAASSSAACTCTSASRTTSCASTS